jgi:hypothetical protein
MAESFNGLYKWELIFPKSPWRGLDDVEFATLEYIDWFNHRRLHGEITTDATYTTPAEHERKFLRSNSGGHSRQHPIAGAVTQPGAVHRPEPLVLESKFGADNAFSSRLGLAPIWRLSIREPGDTQWDHL